MCHLRLVLSMCLPRVGNVRGMSTTNLETIASERFRSPLAIIHLVLLISALSLGLFSMHVLHHPGANSAMVPAAQNTLATELPMHHSSIEVIGHGAVQGCADCPTGHEVAAAGCILALLAFLLFLRPPRILQTAKPKNSKSSPALKLARGILRNKPNLTALGICRT